MKKIVITLYTPKELWIKFWNLVFWPRRKECAEWIDFVKGTIESDLADVFIDNKHMIVQEYFESDNLYKKCLDAINKRLDEVKAIMKKPM